MKAAWWRSPTGVGMILAALAYLGFLLFDDLWTLQSARAVDWVGGALVLVGPLLSGLAAWNTQTLQRVAVESAWSRARSWRLTALTFGRAAVAFVVLHLVVLCIAVAVTKVGGAVGGLLPGAAIRQLVAVAAFVAVGHLAGTRFRTRLVPVVVAVVVFLLPWYFFVFSSASDMFIYTGGSPDIGRGAVDYWPVVGAQLLLWGGIVGVALSFDVVHRRFPGWRKPAALLAGLAMVVGGVGIAVEPPVSFAYPTTLEVRCAGQDPVLCLSSESERGREHLGELAVAVRAALISTGVEPSLFSRVIEGRPDDRRPADSSGNPLLLATGDRVVPVTDQMLRPSDQDLLFVQSLLRNPDCSDTESRWETFEAEYWLYNQIGYDLAPDIAAEIDALGPPGRAWLAESFTGMLTCAPGEAPPLPT